MSSGPWYVFLGAGSSVFFLFTQLRFLCEAAENGLRPALVVHGHMVLACCPIPLGPCLIGFSQEPSTTSRPPAGCGRHGLPWRPAVLHAPNI